MNCRQCGARYDGERWQRLCWSCWREQRDGQTRDDAYHRGWMDGLAAGRKQAVTLDAPLLTTLLKLVHPDHHPAERYELANTTTATLLELREGLAA